MPEAGRPRRPSPVETPLRRPPLYHHARGERTALLPRTSPVTWLPSRMILHCRLFHWYGTQPEIVAYDDTEGQHAQQQVHLQRCSESFYAAHALVSRQWVPPSGQTGLTHLTSPTRCLCRLRHCQHLSCAAYGVQPKVRFVNSPTINRIPALPCSSVLHPSELHIAGHCALRYASMPSEARWRPCIVR
jgi:hypothetical protein